MQKFIIGVLVGGALAFVIAIILYFSLGRNKEKAPQVEPDSVLTIRLSGDVPERAPMEFPIPFFEQATPLTVTELWGVLRKAAVDGRVKAIILEPAGSALGWGKMQELRSDIERFRKSGKPVYAFLKTPGARDYYLAAGASRVYMEPQDYLMLKGARFELMYFKGTLDKLGVTMEMEHAGKYKDYGDTYTRTSMSPETKEVLTSMLDGLYGELVNGIAAGRHKTAEEVRGIIDNGPFLSPEAVKAGLVDRVKYEEDVLADLKSDLKNNDLKKVSARTYSKTPFSAVGLGGKPRVALVVADGEITRGSAESSGENGIESAHLDKILREVAADSGIKGVIVRINSPGGEVTASEEIWHEMNLLSKKRPMVISMSDYAASGGYYMAMTGDPVVSYANTITGSIGVVFGKPNLHGLYDKIGITKDEISRGKYADIDSDYHPLGDAGRAKLQQGIDAEYREFVSKVATARKRKFEDVEPVAQGRAWLGSQAKDRGLVDELGGLDRAIELVKKRAGIGTGDNINLVTYPQRRSFFETIFRKRDDSDAELEARVARYLGMRQVGVKPPNMGLWLRGGMLGILPFRVEFQ